MTIKLKEVKPLLIALYLLSIILVLILNLICFLSAFYFFKTLTLKTQLFKMKQIIIYSLIVFYLEYFNK